jgi:hypothetical protein
MRTTSTPLAFLVVPLVSGWVTVGETPCRAQVMEALLEQPSRISVDEDAREIVVFALLNSPTFRREFLSAARGPGPAVRLGIAAPPSLRGVGSLGSTRWLERPRAVREAAGHVGFRGTIWSRALRGPTRDLAARLGHELAHANELTRYGSITRAPGYRVSVDGRRLAETENGVAIGRQVRIELNDIPFRRPSTVEVEAWLGPSGVPQPLPDFGERRLLAVHQDADPIDLAANPYHSDDRPNRNGVAESDLP